MAGLMIRFGRIDYLNCDPFFEGVGMPEGVQVVRGIPTDLNRGLHLGTLHASFVSSIELAVHPDLYRVVPEIVIAAEGPIQSVVLLSPAPIESFSGKALHVSTDSATSVALLQILMRHHFHLEAALSPWAPSDTLPDGPVLLIGDRALRSRKTPGHPYLYDLCTAWKEMTGLPMVFALACVRTDVLSDDGTPPPSLASLLRGLRRNARRWPHPDREDMVAAGSSRLSLPPALVNGYLAALQLRAGPRHEVGLLRFFQLAHDCGAVTQRVDTLPYVALPPQELAAER